MIGRDLELCCVPALRWKLRSEPRYIETVRQSQAPSLPNCSLLGQMDTSFDFVDVGMDFDAVDVLPTYNLHRRPSTDRLRRLREILKDRGLEAYLIVDSDAHYTFYSQARQDRRINYITNSDVPSPWPRSRMRLISSRRNAELQS